MEGSRHEKAAITAVSYVLGFTAAYILFGNFTSTTTPAFILPETSNSAAVITATETKAVTVEEAAEAVPTEPKFKVSYESGKLEVNVAGSVKLLSFNPETSGLSAGDELTQGSHFGVASYAVSRDEKFVFFCERYDSTEEVCAGYVYDVDADKIFPVTKSGSAVKISLASAEDALFTAVGLKIGSNYSANPKAPWVVISEEEALDLQ